MNPNAARLKYELSLRGETVLSAAQKLGVRRQELSYVIHGTRDYPHIRRALAKLLKLPSNTKLLAYQSRRIAGKQQLRRQAERQAA